MTTEPLPPASSEPTPPTPPATPLPPSAPAPAPARPTSVLAVISLITGIVGLVGWVVAPLIASIIAVVCGHMARAEIRRSPDGMDGDGMAIAGLVTGWLMIAITVLAFVLFFGGLAVLLAMLGLGSQL